MPLNENRFSSAVGSSKNTTSRKNSIRRCFSLAYRDLNRFVRIALQRDEHLIVVAIGENSDLRKGWGRSPYGRMRPVAFTNPIYVDVDRDGFKANGGTLGHPLVTKAAPK